MDFALPFGGTLAWTIVGAVFNNKVAESNLGALVGGAVPSGKGAASGVIDALAGLPPDARAAAQGVFADAVRWAFVGILPFMGLCVVAATLLGQVWVKVRGRKDGASEVLYGSYLAALLTGTVKQKRVRHEVRRGDAGEAAGITEKPVADQGAKSPERLEA